MLLYSRLTDGGKVVSSRLISKPNKGKERAHKFFPPQLIYLVSNFYDVIITVVYFIILPKIEMIKVEVILY
jgi:hypothetical protein